MSKTAHFIPLVCLVICSAALTAFVVHALVIRFVSLSSEQQFRDSRGALQKDKGDTDLFPKDGYGIYVLPSVNPTFPLEPGVGTVGGVTGCARLNNLRTCLQEAGSKLAEDVPMPVATAEAGLEEVCSNILDQLAHIRPASIEAGCIW